MSQPINYYVTRWDLASNGEAKFVSNAFGGFVAWHDYGTLLNNYAALQAEVERLRKAAEPAWIEAIRKKDADEANKEVQS